MANLTLEGFATKLVAKNNFVKASFGGFAGSGKTRTASEFIVGCYGDLKIKKPLLIIDNEKGSRFLIPFFEKAGIGTYVKDTVSLADVLDAITLLNKGEVGFLFIDSLSKVWYQYVRDYLQTNKKKTMYLQDWGKLIPAWQEQFSDKFVELTGNCVFTGRGGFSYELEENDQGKKEFVKSGVKMKLAGETPFEPDLNVWMELQQEINGGNGNGKKPQLKQWREAQILKDRSGTIDGKVFKNPTYKDFKPVLDYLLSVKTGEVAGQSNTTNLAPTDDNGYFANKREREIEIEKFWAEFDWLGTGKEEKSYKNEIFQKFTGTKSKTEFEGFPHAELHNIRIAVEKFMYEFKLKGELGYEDKIAYIRGYNPEAHSDMVTETVNDKNDLPFE